ncbi:MAG TPA: hypothetical protein VFI16_00765, partial [Anaeromyxobacteraceae bacterium]|nr:hypothetical protein [Anaeromyxobacteraceae bacterium]
MPTCKRMTEMATDRVEGGLGFLARLAFDRHLARCDGCTAWVRQLEATRRALGRLPEPEISPGLSEALLAGFDAWAAGRPASPAPRPRPAGRLSPWPLVGAIAVPGLVVAFGRQRSGSPDDWLIGSALALAALAVAAAAGRFAAGAVVAAVAVAVAAALAGGTAGATDAAAGAECLAVELAAAAVVGGAAWLGARRGSRQAVRRALAAGG